MRHSICHGAEVSPAARRDKQRMGCRVGSDALEGVGSRVQERALGGTD